MNASRQKKLSLFLLLALLLAQTIQFPLTGLSKKKKSLPQQTEIEAPPSTKPTSEKQIMIQQWFSRGQWQLVDKNYLKAIIIYKKVLELFPENSRAMNQLALAYYFHGQYHQALTTVNQALKTDPVNTKLYFTKARILDAQSQEAEALDNYLTFASLDPTDTAALQAQQRSDELFKRWEPKLTMEQKAYFTGLRFLSMEQPEKALPLLKRFQQDHTNNLNAYLLLGIAYAQIGKADQAIKSFKILTHKAPDNPMAYFQLGETYARSGKSDEAQSAWQKFLEMAPHSEQASVIHQQLLNKPAL